MSEYNPHTQGAYVFYVLDIVLQSAMPILSVIIGISDIIDVSVILYVLSIANIHFVDIQWSSTYVSFCCCDYLYQPVLMLSIFH